MKRMIKASTNNLSFVHDPNERERYIHSLIGDLDSILSKRGIHVKVTTMDYSIIVDIIGNYPKDIVDTIEINDRDILFDWDDIWFVATQIADKILEEARI